MNYTSENLVRLARRDGNTVRPYLYVNPIQAKHIPADPADFLAMCQALAEKVQRLYPADSFHVIGLAETATAVASGVASYLKHVKTFQTTTRETDPGAACLYFTESHSHATDQTLRSAGLADCLRGVARVLIVDDEVTTGNTILKLIDAIRENGGADHVRFSIVSVLNSMTPERLEELKALGIDCVFLVRLPHEYRADSILDIPSEPDREITVLGDCADMAELLFLCPLNPRAVTRFSEWRNAVTVFSYTVRQTFFPNRAPCERLLVLGTEEWMYPAVMLADTLQRDGLAGSVRVHATTRSPILPSGREGYPLFRRYQLRSLYDDNRRTFIYNLAEYDRVIIVTDARDGHAGLCDLALALRREGCQNIALARWRQKEGNA